MARPRNVNVGDLRYKFLDQIISKICLEAETVVFDDLRSETAHLFMNLLESSFFDIQIMFYTLEEEVVIKNIIFKFIIKKIDEYVTKKNDNACILMRFLIFLYENQKVYFHSQILENVKIDLFVLEKFNTITSKKFQNVLMNAKRKRIFAVLLNIQEEELKQYKIEVKEIEVKYSKLISK